jgi:hypothetical protein
MQVGVDSFAAFDDVGLSLSEALVPKPYNMRSFCYGPKPFSSLVASIRFDNQDKVLGFDLLRFVPHHHLQTIQYQ